MFRQILLGAATVLASTVIVHADAKDDLKAAADKLAAAPSYTYTTDTQNAGGQGFGTGKTVGKIDRSGYSFITAPGMGGAEMQILIKGDKAVLKTQDTWQTPEEMMAAFGGGGGGGGGFNFAAMIINRAKDPVGQAAKNFDKLQNLQMADGAYSGELSPDDSKTAMTAGFGGRGGGQGPDVANAKVTYKIWVKDGVISKVESHTTGTMSFGGNDNPIDRTATTEITDVGSTKVDAPADAVAKLNAPAAPPQQ